MKKREGCGILSLVIEMERNKSYTINKSTMEDLLEYALENTEIEELIRLCFGRRKNKEFVKRVAKSIVESVVIEKLSKARKNELLRVYGLTGELKKKVNEKRKVRNDLNPDSIIEYAECLNEYERQKENERKIEQSFAQGIKIFLAVFENSFENKDLLHKALNRVFKNYKFKDINIVNNYIVLYFTFKLFDIFCSNEDNIDEIKSMALNLAKNAYEELKKSYGKKNVTASQESIYKYISNYEFINPQYVYVDTVIALVQDLNLADSLDDVIRYDIYDRIAVHINRISTILNSIFEENKNDGNEEYKNGYNEEHECDVAKIYKSVYNKIQYMKNKLDSDSVQKFKLLSSTVRKIPKNYSELSKISKKKCENYCYLALEISMDIWDNESDVAKGLLFKILNEYSKIHFENNRGLPIFEFARLEVCCKLYKQIKKISDSKFNTLQKGENVFISLILSQRKITSFELEPKINEILDSTIKLLREYIANNIEISAITMKKYVETAKHVEIDYLKIPILLVDDETPTYSYYVSRIALNIFELMK